MEELTSIHWKLLWVACLVIILVTCLSFAQVMVFRKRISKRGASASEIIIPSGVRWGQLGMFSRSVLCILHSDTCWAKFFRSLILYQEGLWVCSQVLRFITTTCLLMFAWLEQFIEGLLSEEDLWYRSTGFYLLEVPLVHEIIHREFGAIERLNL